MAPNKLESHSRSVYAGQGCGWGCGSWRTIHVEVGVCHDEGGVGREDAVRGLDLLEVDAEVEEAGGLGEVVELEGGALKDGVHADAARVWVLRQPLLCNPHLLQAPGRLRSEHMHALHALGGGRACLSGKKTRVEPAEPCSWKSTRKRRRNSRLYVISFWPSASPATESRPAVGNSISSSRTPSSIATLVACCAAAIASSYDFGSACRRPRRLREANVVPLCSNGARHGAGAVLWW